MGKRSNFREKLNDKIRGEKRGESQPGFAFPAPLSPFSISHSLYLYQRVSQLLNINGAFYHLD
jgi:hypothetical protein